MVLPQRAALVEDRSSREHREAPFVQLDWILEGKRDGILVLFQGSSEWFIIKR